MPIHIRANPGDYAEACLLPGDPLRAKYIAETFFDDVVQRNGERGMLGYSGTFNGKPVSVQSSGMGCPSAAIVIEELVQLGVKKIMRVGTCGGLQPDMTMGDLVIALSATAADSTAVALRPRRAARADRRLRRSSTRRCTRRSTSASRCASARSCRATSSTSPDPGHRGPLVGPRDPGRRDGGCRAVHARARCARSRPAAC